jgi:hypothetical protein
MALSYLVFSAVQLGFWALILGPGVVSEVP